MQKHDYESLHALEENFWWFSGMREVTAALLDPILPGAQDRTILDAGCGTGGNLEWLKRYSGNGNVFGIDLVADAVRFSLQRGSKFLSQASVCELPFASGVFDLVTSFDVVVQVPGEGADEKALREMHRVLRDGGILFLRAAAYDWMRSGHDEALATQRRYSLPALQQKIESAGFRILRSTYANSLLLPAAFVNRLILKRLQIVDNGSDVKELPPHLRWLDRALRSALVSEASWLRRANSSLPAGLSAICIAEKRPTTT